MSTWFWNHLALQYSSDTDYLPESVWIDMTTAMVDADCPMRYWYIAFVRGPLNY